MTLRPRTRISRRTTLCPRHPDEPFTGICASCLRERLSGIGAAVSPSASSPELRRCRSVVSISECEAFSSSLSEQRRKSCDVVSARNSLCNLFDVDDLKGGSESEAKVESKNVGKNAGLIESTKQHRDEIRVSSDILGESNLDCVDGEFKTMKEYIDLEFQSKPKKSKDSRGIAGNLASVFTRKFRIWRQSSNNHKIKNHKNSSSCCKSVSGNDGNQKLFQDGRNSHSEFVGRRSCDTKRRFSVDACQVPFEEPRASWDGYMIARTIPRLAPMFSVVENGVLGSMNKFENRRLSVDGPTMHSIVEDESSSGASGSGHSNSDSSFSVRRSSFDRSSSVRSFGKNAADHGVPPANVKLVITEKELKDWHLGSCRDDGLENLELKALPSNTVASETAGDLNRPAKKSYRWRKVCNVIGLGPKSSERACETLGGNVIDDGTEKQGKGGGGHVRDDAWKLSRRTSVVGPRSSYDVVESNYRRSVDNAGGFAFKGIEDFKLERNAGAKYSSADLGDGIAPFYMTPLRSLNHIEDFKLERNAGAKYSSADLGDGIAPFYMTPLRSLNHCKSGKFKLINPHSTVGNPLQLN